MSKQHRAFIYTRISEDRSGEGLGVDRQERECRQKAEDLGLEVVEVFRDNDRSAYSRRPRPDYERMLSRLSEVSTVIVWQMDRLHRQPAELEHYADLCQQHSPTVKTYAIHGGALDLSTDDDLFRAGIYAQIARRESRIKSRRVQAKSRETITQGRHPGGARPFGFDLVERSDEEVRTKQGQSYVVNEREAEAIRRAADDVLHHGRTLGSICREWNDPDRSGGPLTTVTGRRWTLTPMRKMLSRPRNAGVLEVEGREVYRDESLAILRPATFDALRRHLNRNATPGHTNKAVHLLSGVAECHCGQPVVHRTVGSRTVNPETGERLRHGTYRCPRNGGGHTGKRREFTDAVVKLAVYDLLQMDLSQRVGLTPEQEAEKERVEAELTEIQHRRENLGVEYAEGGLSTTGWRAAEQKLDADEEVLRSRLAELPGDGVEDGSFFVRAARELEQADEAYREFLDWHVDDQREFVRHHLRVRLLPRDPSTPRRFDPATVEVTARRGLAPENPGVWEWREPVLEPGAAERLDRIEPVLDAEGQTSLPRTVAYFLPPSEQDGAWTAPLIRDGERVGVQVWDGPVIGQPVGGYWAGVEDFHERAAAFERRRARLEELEES